MLWIATHLLLVSRLRMSGAIPLLPTYAFIVWTGTDLIYCYCILIHSLALSYFNWQRRRLRRIIHKVRTAQKALFISVIKTSHLTLYREIMAVCSQIHTKHIYTVWTERRTIEC